MFDRVVLQSPGELLAQDVDLRQDLRENELVRQQQLPQVGHPAGVHEVLLQRADLHRDLSRSTMGLTLPHSGLLRVVPPDHVAVPQAQ